ncbi:MAG: caspase family protein [Kofleriaceae bacterium]
MIASRWHAVLVGIDAYQGGAPPLGGCVNDIDAIQHVLLDRLGVPPAQIRRYAAALPDGVVRPTTVATALPTRANLLAALDDVAGAVRPGDRVFVYYAGHGTRRVVQTAAGQRYFREALVPHDHRVFDPVTQDEREQLIFDWEVNQWIARVAQVTTAITMILDCCCAAGTTRSLDRTRARFAPPPRADFMLPADLAPPAGTAMAPSGVVSGAGSVAGCMVVAACLDNEVARESAPADDGGPAHGELTRALLAQLTPERRLDQLAWSTIWRDVVASVRARSPYQTPRLSSHLGRLVFCGPPTEGDLGYAVQQVGTAYRLDAGALSGVTPGAVIAVYPPLARQPYIPPIGDPRELALRTGLLRVTAAEPASATAEPVAGHAPAPLEPGARGRLIEAAADARLRISLTPYDARLAARIAASKLLEVVAPGERGELELVRCANGDRELADDVFGPQPGGASYLLHRIPAAVLAAPPPARGPDPVHASLEHYLAYAAPIRLANACLDLPRALRLRLLDCNDFPSHIPAREAEDVALAELQPDRAPDYQLRPRTDAGGDRFTIELENVSTTDLFVTVLLCQNSGRVALYASQIVVARTSRARVWFQSTKGRWVRQSLPPGQTRALDRVVAIGTSQRGASLDHLQDDRTFAARRVPRNAPRGVAVPPPPRPDVWTSAMAVLRATM